MSVLSGGVAVVKGVTVAQDGQYAPGATGFIPSDFLDALDRAEELAGELQQKLQIQEPAQWSLPIDLDEARRNALNHPRVRALLGTDEGLEPTEAEDQKWQGARVFAFASFSMPKQSLGALLKQGQDMGVPVVFRGFFNNSVYDTRDALIEIFGSDDNIEGFVIDPTLFERFDIHAVPAFVATDVDMDACMSAGCEEDAAPPHDRLAGNVTLGYALDLFERGGGDGAEGAAEVLARVNP